MLENRTTSRVLVRQHEVEGTSRTLGSRQTRETSALGTKHECGEVSG